MARRATGANNQRRVVAVGASLTAFALVAVVALVLAGTAMLAGGIPPTATPGSSAQAAAPAPTPTGSQETATANPPSATPRARPAPRTTTGVQPTPVATSTPTPRPNRPANGAPDDPAEFDLQQQAIDIGFPLRPETSYRYRNNWFDVRDGPPSDYNHARINREGLLVRLHDGIDIYAREGEPLLAPFSGVVIDPARRWQPWEPARYGSTVVIQSDEPTSADYLALFAHLDRVWVAVGDRVERGQIIGTIGRSGNAENQSVHTHLHFELRAPFLLDWTELDEDRLVDAFNAFPSLVQADPKRGG